MTMQKVAWPMTIVQSESEMWPVTKKEFSAIPVMIPGSAIGSTTRNETTSRPKKRKRLTAKAAADPSASAIAVATSPARTESHNAERISELRHAIPNHLVENWVIGQPCTFVALNAYTAMTAIGKS